MCLRRNPPLKQKRSEKHVCIHNQPLSHRLKWCLSAEPAPVWDRPVLIKPIYSVWIRPVPILCGFPSIPPICIYFMEMICQQSSVSMIELCSTTRCKNVLLSHSECWWPEARLQPKFPRRRKCHSAPSDNTNQWSSCFSSTPDILSDSVHVRLTGGSLFRNVICLW